MGIAKSRQVPMCVDATQEGSTGSPVLTAEGEQKPAKKLRKVSRWELLEDAGPKIILSTKVCNSIDILSISIEVRGSTDTV
jgi:hypothetical protein